MGAVPLRLQRGGLARPPRNGELAISTCQCVLGSITQLWSVSTTQSRCALLGEDMFEGISSLDTVKLYC